MVEGPLVFLGEEGWYELPGDGTVKWGTLCLAGQDGQAVVMAKDDGQGRIRTCVAAGETLKGEGLIIGSVDYETRRVQFTKYGALDWSCAYEE